MRPPRRRGVLNIIKGTAGEGASGELDCERTRDDAPDLPQQQPRGDSRDEAYGAIEEPGHARANDPVRRRTAGRGPGIARRPFACGRDHDRPAAAHVAFAPAPESA